MAFEETREQQQMYNYFRSCIYIFLIIEIVMNLPITADNRVTQFILDLLGRFKVFNSVSGCKVAELICICVVCIGTKAKKALKFNVKTMVIYPVLAGLTLVGMCFIFHGMNIGMSWFGFPANRILYALCSVVGTMLVHQGLDGIAKYYNYKVGEDRFNFENESFQQSETLVANDYSVNIPMIYYWKQKMHKGWINIINPFRGTIVLGTPGSGKSFGIIDPFIRQHAAKGFAIMCYDFKFPTLAKTLFYQYCKNKKAQRLPKNCGFHIINFTDVEYSDRINPIQRKYIPDLAAASETAATLLASLNKGGGEKKGGSEAFFTNSAENFQPTKTVKTAAEEKPAKEKKTEAKAEVKSEQQAEQKAEAKQERKPREPQMITANGEKVSHGHAFQSTTNPADWYFTAKMDGVQLKPQKMDAADLAAYQKKEMTVPQLMEKYYPTKLMPKVSDEAFQMPKQLSSPDGAITIDKFNVYKEKDEQRPDYGKYKFYVQMGDTKMSAVASREDLNAYFDRVVSPTQLVEKNFGERLHLQSAYEKYQLPEGVDPKGVRVAKDHSDNKWKVSMDLGDKGKTSKHELSFDDGYSLFKAKTATREQIAAKYLNTEITGMLSAVTNKLEKSASMKM